MADLLLLQQKPSFPWPLEHRHHVQARSLARPSWIITGQLDGRDKSPRPPGRRRRRRRRRPACSPGHGISNLSIIIIISCATQPRASPGQAEFARGGQLQHHPDHEHACDPKMVKEREREMIAPVFALPLLSPSARRAELSRLSAASWLAAAGE
ncbi:hypothetical protein GGR56DRAFT_258925 [Xylariaceae sp. FL0804]|nr:hypothetical protein GGR56DRAFT_258925 [Xylariaceae sp. FL0804]